MRRFLKIAVSCLLSASLAFAAMAQPAKRMTIEDALALLEVGGAPQWSPDGKWLAFTVSEWNRRDVRRDSHIYLAPSSGAARPLRLTNGERGETQPQWSPDSTRIAFLANRDAPRPDAGAATPPRNQVWSISVGGGEAAKITDEESGVTQFRWSPDGRRIAYVVRDTPKDKAERDKRKKEKFDAIVVDGELAYSHLWVIDLDTRERKRVTEGAYTVSDPQWSPDGKWLAYVHGRSGAQESAFTDISEDRNSDVYVVPASSGGQPRQLTASVGPDAQPRWSPDGAWIAYTASEDPASWAAKTELMVVAAGGGGQPRSLTAGHHDSVTSAPEWSPDGRFVYAGGAVGVYGQLLKVAVMGGEPAAVFESPGAYGGIDVSADGQMLAFTYNDARSPDEVYVATSGGKAVKRLTDFNPQAKNFQTADTDVIRWKSPADGLEIEGLLVKPLDYQQGKRYPLILQIHGGPYGRFSRGFNARAQIFAANGYAVLQPNPRGSTGYGHKFSTANVKDWGGKDFQDIMSGVDEAIKMGVADPENLFVMGGSYGGFMTFWTVTQTERFRAAIGHAGISDWYSFHGQTDVPGLLEYGFGGTPWAAREVYERWSPMRHVDRAKTPLMITHGEQDRRVPIAQAEQFYRALRKRGVPVVFVRYPREGHGITEPNHQIDLIGRQLEWFAKHRKPAAN